MTRPFCFAVCSLTLLACGSNNDDNNLQTNSTSGAQDMSTSALDMRPGQEQDMRPAVDMRPVVQQDMAPALDMRVVEEDMGAATQDMSAPPEDMTTQGTTATLTGTLTRSTDPRNGGIGNLYIAVLDGDPILGSPNLVARQLIENVDVNPADFSITYEVKDIPVRSEKYYYTAFLDDNMNAGMGADAGPDKGDLIELSGFSVPTKVIDQPITYQVDITLNNAVPF